MNKMIMNENDWKKMEKKIENEEKMINKIAKRSIKKCVRQSRINNQNIKQKTIKTYILM